MLAFGALLSIAGFVSAALSKRSLYPSMPNTTCITAPPTNLDDSWIANAPLQASIAGGQPGVSMLLDIGVIDTTTCQPIPDILVEVWSANAVGEYGDDFLRGASMTGSNGIVEFDTIFPGYTTGATSAAFIGEVFFTDPWTNIIGQWQMYAANTNTRMLNDADPVFHTASANGMYPVADVEEINDDWPEGIVAYLSALLTADKLNLTLMLAFLAIGIDTFATPLPL
ncbi:aromatic compound dioxygenase [Vararia minispora EC-137]|uniref:Aromatic compound dioxygenase n=1 Tax=Vararia minispora EC-137 TaxID=1314806 RepID=A0ACB8QZA8_9AGAM|nr:aromatic compound dioxygenase [Vararia minispora EC-137]